MPSTNSENEQTRREFSADVTAMPDSYITALFDDAESEYSTYARRVQKQAVYYTIAKHLRNAAARQVDYQQNEAQESLSDLFKALEKLVAAYKKDLDTAIADVDVVAQVAVRWGSRKAIPSRIVDNPNA